MNNVVRTRTIKASCIVSGLIAIFWTIFYVSTGTVPEMVNTMSLTPAYTWDPPFGESRWFDVLLIGPIWVPLFALVFSNKHFEFNLDEFVNLRLVAWGYLSLCGGLIIGLAIYSGEINIQSVVLATVGMELVACVCLGPFRWTNLMTSVLILGFTTALIGGWIYGLTVVLPSFILLSFLILSWQLLILCCQVIILLIRLGHDSFNQWINAIR